MLNNLKTNVIVPLMSRLGTATAMALVGYGLSGDTAHQVGIAVCAAGLVIADLFLDWISKRGQK